MNVEIRLNLLLNNLFLLEHLISDCYISILFFFNIKQYEPKYTS